MSEVAWIAPNHASRFGGTILQPHEEQHYSIRHWARRWGFSEKTVREWLRDEYGPGILRQPNLGRRRKRDYTTVRISASAAARVYDKRIGGRKPREVM
jgi:transposase